MNRKHTIWNHLLAALLIAALLVVQAVPALAVDGDGQEPATPTQAVPTPTGNDGEGNDTPGPDSPSNGLITASTLEELIQAIEQAEPGAVIGVGCEIVCPDGTILGSPDKAVTIQRTAPEGHVIFSNGDGTGNATIQNISFDGAGVEAFYSYVNVSLSADFTNCSFINCIGSDGAALCISEGNTTLTGCTFDNNSGQQGAHLRIDGGTTTIENSTFTGATATRKGGAIVNFTDQKTTLTGCTITGNQAAQRGGGIWNSGNLDVSQCKIYGNTANGEADDIVNEYWGRLGLKDDHAALVELYAADGVTPNKWAVDTFTDGMGPDTTPHMIFSMTFEDTTPAPEPTPEPTPEPEPSTPTYSRPSVRPSVTKEEEPKEITLTNGKAVLKAPEALYLAGYEDSRGGGVEPVTRADLALLVCSMMDQASREDWDADQAPFDDVEPGSWCAAAIGTAFRAEVMVGCGDGRFAPDRPLTWGELITVFSRFADGEEPAEVYSGPHWAKDAINTAISLDWIEYAETFDPGGPVSCGEMVDFIQTVFQWAASE